MSPDECEDGGGGRVFDGCSVGEATASSSGFAMRRPPRAPLNDRSPLMSRAPVTMLCVTVWDKRLAALPPCSRIPAPEAPMLLPIWPFCFARCLDAAPSYCYTVCLFGRDVADRVRMRMSCLRILKAKKPRFISLRSRLWRYFVTPPASRLRAVRGLTICPTPF